MKNNKWLTYLLVTILALAVVGTVGFFAYQYGLTQGSAAAADGSVPFFANGFGMGFNHPNMHAFGGRGGFMNRGHMGGFFFFPLFGLGRLLFYGLLIWVGYKLIQGSGWKLVKETPPAGAPKSE